MTLWTTEMWYVWQDEGLISGLSSIHYGYSAILLLGSVKGRQALHILIQHVEFLVEEPQIQVLRTFQIICGKNL